jgi:diguanylate cyclase (GGDEF)-like protein/PAS domain S-box-containing protein
MNLNQVKNLSKPKSNPDLSIESHLRSLLQNLKEAVIVLNQTGVVLYANPQAEKLLEICAQDLGETPLSYKVNPTTPTKLDILTSAGEKTLEVGHSADISWGNQNAVIMYLYAFNLSDLESNPQRDENYRSLFDNVPIGIYRTSPEGKIIDANSWLVNILKYPDRETLLTKNVSELYEKQEERDQMREQLGPVDRAHKIEMQLRCFDGTSIWVEDNFRPIYDDPGNLLFFEGSLKDITERKMAEEALRDSEHRFRTLFEYSPTSLWDEDFSEVKKYIDNLKQSGVTDFRAYFDEHPKALIHCASLIKINHVNQATLDFYNAKSKDELEKGFISSFREENINIFKEELMALIGGSNHYETEFSPTIVTGFIKHAVLKLAIVPGYEQTWSKVFISIIDITERKQAEERLHYLASHDLLTSLPNRALYFDRLNHAIRMAKRNETFVVIIFLDLDGFKQINDSFGHANGDKLLKLVAKRLKERTRKSDTIARLSGDEFTFILENIADKKDAAIFAKDILSALERPFEIASTEVSLTASIGMSVCPVDGEDPETLLMKADSAMYRIKKSGRNRYDFYSN